MRYFGKKSPRILHVTEFSVEVASPAKTPLDEVWVTIVWDDPVSLMDYVTAVFQQYFKISRAKAEHLMLKVHNEGKAVVSSGSRERMELDVQAMHSYALQATMQRGGD